MTTDLTIRDVDQSNDLAIATLIAEKRDEVMRAQLNVSGKFMDKIKDHLDDVADEKMSRGEQRKTLRSLAETMKVVADVQAKAAMFDRVSKPKEQEQGRVSLVFNCSPVGVSMKPAIDVTCQESCTH